MRRATLLTRDPGKARAWRRRSKRLKPMSKRRQRYEAELHHARSVVYLRSGGFCEGRVPGICRGFGEEVHHILRRSQGGTNDPSNLVHLCGACHREVHRRPAAAYEAGLLRRSWEVAS